MFVLLRTLVQLGGDIDFVVTRIEEPGWVGAMFQWLVDPPDGAIVLMLIAGIALLLWDGRRNARSREVREVRLQDERPYSQPAPAGP